MRFPLPPAPELVAELRFFWYLRLSYPCVGPREIVVICSARWGSFSDESEPVTGSKSEDPYGFRRSFRYGRKHEEGEQDFD